MIKNKLLLVLIILTSNSVLLESSNLVIKNAEIYDGIENNSYHGTEFNCNHIHWYKKVSLYITLSYTLGMVFNI